MLFPRLFSDVFDDDFSDFVSGKEMLSSFDQGLMKTDIKEVGSNYELDMDLPGFKKEDICIELEDGYLKVSASRSHHIENNESMNYIRQERYIGSCSRSFYVGDDLKHEDIHAQFDSGILKLSFPKKEYESIENKKYIHIE